MPWGRILCSLIELGFLILHKEKIKVSFTIIVARYDSKVYGEQGTLVLSLPSSPKSPARIGRREAPIHGHVDQTSRASLPLVSLSCLSFQKGFSGHLKAPKRL